MKILPLILLTISPVTFAESFLVQGEIKHKAEMKQVNTVMKEQMSSMGKLFNSGVIDTFYISPDKNGRAEAIYVVNSDSEQAAKNIVNSTPIMVKGLADFSIKKIGSKLQGGNNLNDEEENEYYLLTSNWIKAYNPVKHSKVMEKEVNFTIAALNSGEIANLYLNNPKGDDIMPTITYFIHADSLEYALDFSYKSPLYREGIMDFTVTYAGSKVSL
ncbi:hypothetical protein HQQ94_01245 [Shewanella sp. VB17]|uniref:hypothetical protein n=1 Tax=Shewanella sp. VB17 TaxID=2739432 RepID=UPI00156559AF|nr:hypothetical protein [Shewanella sp. VB17]NRD71891.1 hypothetical protein [Shewanella sp. VB17]